ncbi:histidine kinase [Paenibacillus sp. 32O-W]|uniref:sensor histidine kinase n=1 Tax=Paenibacillus sp. 32O-W TaxID=1695218 RepID=UPI00071EEEB6|nr:sensor histidine kinase [Paenibacillus sp. 32O-W]ALS26242.1 histidine kinase [Paenibacillus sp. 32O-W]
MSKTVKNKMYSIKHYVKMLLLISFITLILDLIISFASIALVQQQSARYLQDAADLYINRINNNFSYLNHFMGWTLANDEDVEVMTSTVDSNDANFIKAQRNLYKRFSELQKSFGREYNFFIYLRNKNFLLNSAPMNLSFPEYQALKKQITDYAEEKIIYEKFYSQWTTIDLHNRYYIINIVPYYDSYMISLISADDLIRPLREINLGGNGFVSLMNEKGERVTRPVSNNGKLLLDDPDKSSLLDRLHIGTTVNRAFSNASFYVKLVIQFGAFEKIMIAQLLVVLLAVIIACNLCLIMLYFQKKVLKPIKNFSSNLAILTNDGEPIDFKSSKMIELEKANRQFIDLVTQMKQIKIDLYERELEKQKIQLDYMKLQIKPHFFLNCLTTIYSMAQMQMHAEIQNMTLSISKYFRYIFQNGQDFVRLEDEIEHVRTYLEIQKQRYRNAFDYRIEQAERTADVRIPPLVLQTFIENAMKYAVSREYEVQVVLTVTRQVVEDEEMTVIRISDTGPGFPQAVLDNLVNGQPLDQTEGTRIGIMNTIQRLEHLYHNKAQVRFSNREGGGACVVLYLPDHPEDRTGLEGGI